MSKYGVFSGPYFPVFGLNTEIYGVNSVFSPNAGKYGPEKTSCLDSFHVVASLAILKRNFSEEERPKSPEHDSHSLKQFLKFFQS